MYISRTTRPESHLYWRERVNPTRGGARGVVTVVRTTGPGGSLGYGRTYSTLLGDPKFSGKKNKKQTTKESEKKGRVEWSVVGGCVT